MTKRKTSTTPVPDPLDTERAGLLAEVDALPPGATLSDEQTARFEAVALTAEKKKAQAETAAAGDAARFQEAMSAIFKERQAAVEKILTPPQWQQYEAYMAKARKAIGKPVPAPTKAPA